MTSCPQCNEKPRRLSGGYKHIGDINSIAYYFCDDCELKFSVTGHVVKIMTDEPGQTFKSKREAFRVLRLAMRDDRAWFDGITEETETLARGVWQNWIVRR